MGMGSLMDDMTKQQLLDSFHEMEQLEQRRFGKQKGGNQIDRRSAGQEDAVTSFVSLKIRLFLSFVLWGIIWGYLWMGHQDSCILTWASRYMQKGTNQEEIIETLKPGAVWKEVTFVKNWVTSINEKYSNQ